MTSPKRLIPAVLCLWAALAGAASELDRSVVVGPLAPRDYWLFESGPVRPLALSHDGRRLYAANIPDGRLEIFAVTPLGLTQLGSVPVGLEPVAVAVAPDDRRVWVVNHLSDSVSIVNVAGSTPFVEDTLLVGDEPRDIVFAGPGFSRAFVTTARRGQNHPLDPGLTTPGLGRASVWVFDADDAGGGLGGEPLAILTLFGDTPRALAASADGASVYAAVFRSGNRTTTVPPASRLALAFNLPPPDDSADGVPAPTTGIIVKQVGNTWEDELGRSYNAVVGLQLPDRDVFEIDALADPPTEVNAWSGVGTTLFNMAVNPVNGDVYVANTDARNHVRFAGQANRAESTVRGRLMDHRISLIQGQQVQHRDLNHHLDFGREDGTQQDRDTSLSSPLGMAVSADGATLYLAAYGSSKVAVYDTAALTVDTHPADSAHHIELQGGGPAGLVLDERRGRLYVLTRFDNAVSVINLESRKEEQRLVLFNPEPDSVTRGRKFLYDARLTSGFGNDSCHGCHLFGDNDALAWDLGDPDGEVKPIPNAYHPLTASNPGLTFEFHPLKGPMTTQSMRGLPRHGPQHWRGDRTGQDRLAGETLEEAAFKEFNEAFDALMALGATLPEEDMQAFTDFSLQLAYPPNPVRNLDNSLTESQELGKNHYENGVLRANGVLEVCVTCHPIDPANGIFGTTGTMAFNAQPGETDFKIPHFRDQYQKVGMFTAMGIAPQPQVRGFALNHNGATSINATFQEFGVSGVITNALKQFLFAFPSESAPVMGQQISLASNRYATRADRFDLLLQRAHVADPVPECDLVARQAADGLSLGWFFDRATGLFESSAPGGGKLDADAMRLRAENAAEPITFTCAPWGSGRRIGLDRDGDGVPDAAEMAQGSNPGDSRSSTFRAAAGLWWDAGKPGSGYDLQHGGGNLSFTWYTYRADRSPVWYQAVAPAGDRWQAELIEYAWDPASGGPAGAAVGQVSLEFSDAKHALLQWRIGEQAGQETIERFRFAAGLTELPFTGLWYDPGEPGWGLSVDAQGSVRVIAVYFYGSDNRPRWVLLQQDNTLGSVGTGNSFAGACPWCEWAPPVAADGGSVALDFGDLYEGVGDIQIYLDQPGQHAWLRSGVALRRLTTLVDQPQF